MMTAADLIDRSSRGLREQPAGQVLTYGHKSLWQTSSIKFRHYLAANHSIHTLLIHFYLVFRSFPFELRRLSVNID